MKIDFYSGLGFALELLANSDYHRRFPCRDYFQVEILPPLWRGQVRFHLSESGEPTAMVTWAWLSEDSEREVHATGRALRQDEWSGGERLFFNDWIAPYGNVLDVLRDIDRNVFPNEVGTSMRRNPDGSVRRINRWKGRNRREENRRSIA